MIGRLATLNSEHTLLDLRESRRIFASSSICDNVRRRRSTYAFLPAGGALKSGRLVYATGAGRLCPGCGWPEKDCRCSRAFEEAVPEKITARLRIETSGRAGKTVTVLSGLPRNTPFLKRVCQELKKSCGTGGRTAEDSIELQGDQRERLRDLLRQKGWSVKG